ncbi:MAG: hypothetical protein V3U86_08755 [Acidobacteriota bacterium]|nr:hypothetical protein [Acidobacteriota bacterium]
MRATWWLRNPRYFLFMVREFSSVFVAAFLVLFLLQIRGLRAGAEVYQEYLERLHEPGWIAFHAVAFLFAMYHSLTWFDLTSKIQVVRLGRTVVNRRIVAGLNILAWLVVSGGIFLYWTRG